MLVLIYTRSDDFYVHHERAVTGAGHECVSAGSIDDLILLLRSLPVDVIYVHMQTVGNEYNGLAASLEAFQNYNIRLFAGINLDKAEEHSHKPDENCSECVYTCNNDPRPFIACLQDLSDELAADDTEKKQRASLQACAIDNASFSWNFSCYAGIEAIRANDMLKQITCGTQSFLIPIEHNRNIQIILTELYNNAVDHGILTLPSELKQDAEGFAKFYELRLSRLNKLKTGFIDISLSQVIVDHKVRISILLADSGKGFEYDNLFNAAMSDSAYGRGIPIIRKLSKSIEYKGNGNEVAVIYEWPL